MVIKFLLIITVTLVVLEYNQRCNKLSKILEREIKIEVRRVVNRFNCQSFLLSNILTYYTTLMVKIYVHS